MQDGAGGILLVCAANICRSVYGAAILTRALDSASIPVASAGADAIEGDQACPVVRDLIAAEGLPQPLQLTSGARLLALDDLHNAALIITFTARQRGLVARLAPASRDRLFTLLEASNLAAAISAKRLHPGGIGEWVELLHLNRPVLALLAKPATPKARRWWQRGETPEPALPWDIPDAHSAADAIHTERLALVAEHCNRLGTILARTNG